MPLFRRTRSRYGIAFGEHFLLAARLDPSDEAAEAVRRDLPPDLMAVSSVEPNVRAVSQLARLTGDALQEVGCGGGPVAVVLPDLAIRSFVFADGGKLGLAELASRLAPRLSYPSSEAILDTWQAAADWVLAAAIRRVVLHQYEQAVEAVGCYAAWVDGASLVRIPVWTAEAREKFSHDDSGGLNVHVQLYPGCYTLILFRRRELLDVRTRLRYPTDRLKVVEDLIRIPSLYEGGECRRLTVRGEGAAALVDELEGTGLARERLELGEEGEEAHLRGLVEILIRRI